MKVLVDTSVWSLVLRRANPDAALTAKVSSLIDESRLAIIGPIRQEMLSGIKSSKQFKTLAQMLRPFHDEAISSDDYVLAAEFYNSCRSRGLPADTLTS